MKNSDILDEAPTDLWIRPDPPENPRRRSVPVPKKRPSAHIIRRRQPTEPAVAPSPMSGRSCMLNLVDDLGLSTVAWVLAIYFAQPPTAIPRLWLCTYVGTPAKLLK